MMVMDKSESLIPIQNSNNEHMKITNDATQALNHRKWSMKQPKYFKNMNMPASLPSHQTSIQPW